MLRPNVRSHRRAPLDACKTRCPRALPRGLRCYATFCILFAKSRPEVEGGRARPSL